MRIGLAAVGLVALLGGTTFWWVFIRDDTPGEAALVERAVVEDSTGELDGPWTVTPGGDVFAGYRITEHFSAIDNTAVARTGEITGDLTIEGSQITEVTASVDMASLTSQDNQIPGVGNRDAAMRTMGLETDTFPTATFTLTEPIELGTLPEPGRTVTVEALGDLDLHGEIHSVALSVEARWNGEIIDLTGSVDVALADHAIEPPAAQIVTVADVGILELQLTFGRET